MPLRTRRNDDEVTVGEEGHGNPKAMRQRCARCWLDSAVAVVGGDEMLVVRRSFLSLPCQTAQRGAWATAPRRRLAWW